MKNVLLIMWAIVVLVWASGCGKAKVVGCCEGAGMSCASGVTVTKTFCDALPGEFIEGKSCDRGGKCTL
jgi:hypothetical protein